MDLQVGLKEIAKFLQLFTAQKQEQKIMKTLRRLVLKSFGNLRQGRLVVSDDGALLPCAINAACAALVDAAIPLKHLAVAVCCCVTESGYVILDPTKVEEQNMRAFAYLVFPNSVISIIPEGSTHKEGEQMEHGIITSVTHGLMPVDDYLRCLERGQAASAKMSAFLRRSLQSQTLNDSSKAG